MNEDGQDVKLGDAEIQANLDILKKTAKNKLLVAFALMLVICGFGISAVIIQNNGNDLPTIWFAALCVVCAATFVAFAQTAKANNQVKAFISANVTRRILEEAFDVDEYAHASFISANLINEAGLMGEWDRIDGSDLVRGRYKGRSIMFSDIKLEKRRTSTNSNGDSETRYDTVFHGQWYFIEHDKRLDAILRLREKSTIFGGLMKSDIETENAAFNDKFQIVSTDEQAAFLILTPHFMEFITSTDAKAGGQTYINFAGNRTCIAIYNNSDMFEFSSNDLNELRERQRSDIQYITGILDELLQNDYLFGSENRAEEVSGSPDASATASVPAPADWSSLAEVALDDGKKHGIFSGLNPVALLLMAVYAASAIYTLFTLPNGIVLSTDIYDPDAVTVSTPVYIIVLTVFVVVFNARFLTLRVRGAKTGFIGKLLLLGMTVPSIIGTLLLLLIHYLFVTANIGG